MDWEAITGKLELKLDPANVKKPSGNFGPKGDYIEGWHAIAEANEIFGFGNWSYTIKSMTQDALTEANKNGNTQWQAAYTCIVTVRVDDVVREDVGFGSGFAKQIGDAIEGATKEAVTDALKRALRTFGNRFGLALYDKSRENVGVDLPPFDAAAATQRIKDKLNNCKTVQQLIEAWKDEQSAIAAVRAAEPALEIQIVNLKDKLKTDLLNDPAMQAPQNDDGHMYQ